MTETLTGKAALLAILEGTHEWEDEDGLMIWIEDRLDGALIHTNLCDTLDREIKMQAFDIREILRRTWTRGEPIEDLE